MIPGISQDMDISQVSLPWIYSTSDQAWHWLEIQWHRGHTFQWFIARMKLYPIAPSHFGEKTGFP